MQNQAIADYPEELFKSNFKNNFGLETVSKNTRIGVELPNLKVLMYHRIVKDKKLSEKCELCVHEDEFRKQLEVLLQLGYTPITFKDLQLFKKGEILLPKKPVIISFDDGYLDIYERAYPILKEYGMNAVVFVLGDRSIQTNIWDQEIQEIPLAPLMKDHHIKELHAKGFEIGAHTLSHVNMLDLSYEEVQNEISRSKLIIESMIQSDVCSISYPYGLVDQHIKQIVSESGYEFGCSVYTGPPNFGTDFYEIRRLTIKNTTNIAGFLMRLKAPYEYAEWLWWKSKQVQFSR